MLSETEPPTKEHTWAWNRPPYTDVQLGLYVGPLTTGAVLFLTLLSNIGSLSYLDYLVGPQGERMCLVLLGLDVPG